MLWEKRYNGPPNSINQAQALALDSTGNVVVTGTSRENGWDFYTVEYAAADGALLWEMRYSGAAKVYNSANAVAVDGNGNVAVTGSSGRDYATIFYRKGLPAVLLDLLPSGIRLRFSGNPGLSYNLERATAITGPWIKIDTQIAPGSNLLEYLDASAPLRQAFYRTVQP
jgi:hypothetical protein